MSEAEKIAFQLKAVELTVSTKIVARKLGDCRLVTPSLSLFHIFRVGSCCNHRSRSSVNQFRYGDCCESQAIAHFVGLSLDLEPVTVSGDGKVAGVYIRADTGLLHPLGRNR